MELLMEAFIILQAFSSFLKTSSKLSTPMNKSINYTPAEELIFDLTSSNSWT